jgi:hypothetical protein
MVAKGMAAPEAGTETLTLDDRIRAERLKEEIWKLQEAQAEIAARFAIYSRCSVEEQLAIRLAFDENRKLLGQVSRELLRLVCF